MKDFVPYQPSLDMKELGFDEPCIGYYHNHVEFSFVKDLDRGNTTKNSEQNLYSTDCAAPTFSQAFRFFREKYGLFVAPSAISYEGGPHLWFFEINSTTIPFGTDLGVTDDFKTYEEAELACLIKLIEIVKNK